MADLELIQQTLAVRGQVNFDNAAKLYQQGVVALKSVQQWPVLVDLSQVEHGNTLLLAVVLQWLKLCPKMDSLQLVQVPTKMQGIIEASHLELLMQN